MTTPYQPAPPPPKKKSNALIIFGVIGGLIVLCCGGGIIAVAVSGGEDKTPPGVAATGTGAAPATGGKSAVPQAAKIGQPVRDGKFEFVVKTMKCGVVQVGDKYLNKKAQGQYCLVTVTVKNIGDEARTLDDSNQFAYDASGRKFETDEAGMYANKDTEVFLNNINPGNSVTGIVVFDIPKDTKLVKLELHDSPFSGGVDVSLT